MTKKKTELFTLTTNAQLSEEGMDVTINIITKCDISEDAPPSLMDAIYAGLGKFLAESQGEETAMKMAHDFRERAARKQRQADQAARELIGEDGPEPV